MLGNMSANEGDIRDEVGPVPVSGRSPWGENGNTPVFLPGKSHG